MKKLFLLTLITIFSIAGLFAQDEGFYTHYHINPTLVNPAAAGFPFFVNNDDAGDATDLPVVNTHNFFFNFRKQWSGFAGSPSAYSLSYNGPLGKQKAGFGIGAGFFGEDVARLSRLRGQLALSYRYEMEEFLIGIGFSAEYKRLRLDPSVRNDPFFDENDAVIEEHINGVDQFDASIGIFGTYNERTYFGVSLPSIVTNRLDEIGNEDSNSTTSLLSYYTFLLGHRFAGKGSTWVEPSLMLRKVLTSPLQLEANLKMGLPSGGLVGGISYRYGADSALGILIGLNKDLFQLYYSYDYFLGDFNNFNGGSHEVTLGIAIDQKNNGKFDRSRKYRK